MTTISTTASTKPSRRIPIATIVPGAPPARIGGKLEQRHRKQHPEIRRHAEIARLRHDDQQHADRGASRGHEGEKDAVKRDLELLP